MVGPNPGKGGGVGIGSHPEAKLTHKPEVPLGKGPRKQDVSMFGPSQGKAYAEPPNRNE